MQISLTAAGKIWTEITVFSLIMWVMWKDDLLVSTDLNSDFVSLEYTQNTCIMLPLFHCAIMIKSRQFCKLIQYFVLPVDVTLSQNIAHFYQWMLQLHKWEFWIPPIVTGTVTLPPTSTPHTLPTYPHPQRAWLTATMYLFVMERCFVVVVVVCLFAFVLGRGREVKILGYDCHVTRDSMWALAVN